MPALDRETFRRLIGLELPRPVVIEYLNDQPPPTALYAELAERRAMRLLWSFLDDDQKASLDRENAFLLLSQSGLRYRISLAGISHNVTLQDIHPDTTFCAHLPLGWGYGGFPKADHILAQAMHLRVDEMLFHLTAIARYGPGFVPTADCACVVHAALREKAKRFGQWHPF